MQDGYVIGAIGVSGASSADEDQELAVLGAQALEAPANGHATFFPSPVVEAGSGILLDAKRYKLDAGRRLGPGEAECHPRDVDVMHVIHGSATIVTGGELNGTAIEGGEEHRLAEGDLLAIPSGVPHQFVDVSAPFDYFVVKVEA